MKVVFIIPMFNAAPHVKELVESLKSQKNPNWEAILIDDMSNDDTIFMVNHCVGSDERFSFVINKEKKWALKNVVENAKIAAEEKDCIIAVLDGDDMLCNENTVELLLESYKDDEVGTVWTGHKWDINNINISKELPQEPPVNPYEYPWVTSHLKTFRSRLLLEVNEDNFKDMDGNWFKRGYDQALYLPLLFLSIKRKYIDEVCYYYRINSNSMLHREWKEKDQLNTVKIVRSRGFIK
jgi:glycosyltransferase involved in cell wall biosynthesis